MEKPSESESIKKEVSFKRNKKEDKVHNIDQVIKNKISENLNYVSLKKNYIHFTEEYKK